MPTTTTTRNRLRTADCGLRTAPPVRRRASPNNRAKRKALAGTCRLKSKNSWKAMTPSAAISAANTGKAPGEAEHPRFSKQLHIVVMGFDIQGVRPGRLLITGKQFRPGPQPYSEHGKI